MTADLVNPTRNAIRHLLFLEHPLEELYESRAGDLWLLRDEIMTSAFDHLHLAPGNSRRDPLRLLLRAVIGIACPHEDQRWGAHIAQPGSRGGKRTESAHGAQPSRLPQHGHLRLSIVLEIHRLATGESAGIIHPPERQRPRTTKKSHIHQLRLPAGTTIAHERPMKDEAQDKLWRGSRSDDGRCTIIGMPNDECLLAPKMANERDHIAAHGLWSIGRPSGAGFAQPAPVHGCHAN